MAAVGQPDERAPPESRSRSTAEADQIAVLTRT